MTLKKKILIGGLVIVGLLLLVLGSGIYLSLKKAETPENVVEMTIKGDSMEPSLKAGQKVKVDRDYYKNNPVQRGDIVAFQLKTVKDPLVKRVIALPGDKLEFKQGQILVNGEKIKEEYLFDINYRLSEAELKIIKIPLRYYGRVPQGSLLTLSDNRQRSYDSRRFGFVPKKYIIGKIIKY